MSDSPTTPSWQETHNPDPRPEYEQAGSTGAGPLVPNVDLPLGPTVTYQTLTITSVGQTPDGLTELEGPIDPLGAVAPSVDTPAEGVLLSHEQAWRMKGVTIGRLLHSLSLAPGEVTQVATSTFDRRTHGQSAAATAESEQASQSAGRDRSINDVVSAVADEHQFSFGSTTASSSQSQGGVNIGIFNASGSSNRSSASSIGIATGGRSVAADSTQRVRQSTQQHAANVRGRRATVVQEVGQGDSEQFRTRVVANYNHTHSLNMLYFEVLQVYELATKVVEAERCIFVPMQVMEFNPLRVAEFARPLAQAARQRGDNVLGNAIEDIEKEMESIELRKQQMLARLNAAHITLESERSKLGHAKAAQLEAERELRSTADQLSIKERELAELHEAWRLHINRERNSPNVFDRIGAEFEVIEEEIQSAFGAGQIARTQREVTALRDALSQAQGRMAMSIEGVATQQALFDLAQGAHGEAEIAHEAEVEASRFVGQDVIRQLEADRIWYNHALWYRLEPSQIAHMLAGKTLQGQSLVESVDPTPLAVFGNYVAFRWNFGPNRRHEAERFRQRHLHDDGAAALDTVVLPTDAVFAEAVPGSANSAEKLDITRFWKWDDKTIPILPTGIAKIHQQQHAQQAELRPGSLGQPAVSIGALPDAPPGPAHELAGIVGSHLFRNITGSDTIEAVMTKAQQVTGEGAIRAQKTANDSVSDLLDHVEEMAPKVMELMKNRSTSKSTSGSGKDGEGGKGGLPVDPSTLGGLQNALGGAAEEELGEGAGAGAEAGAEGAAAAGVDVGALLSEAAELGVFLL